MSKCKICPACNAENDPRNMECVECSYDLMSTPVVDPEEISKKEEAIKKDEEAPIQSDLVRICYCGEHNPSQLRKCQRCREDISDIVPVPKPQETSIRYQLEDIESGFIYPVPSSTVIIGRENCMKECLARKLFVSRTHARLFVEDGKLYIENLSKTNFTYVNNSRITDEKTELFIGDEIGLGGIVLDGKRQEQAAFFIVGKQL